MLCYALCYAVSCRAKPSRVNASRRGDVYNAGGNVDGDGEGDGDGDGGGGCIYHSEPAFRWLRYLA